jgi:hypothetical protein
MLLNHATPKQRFQFAAIAFIVLLPVVLLFDDVPKVYRLSQSGQVLSGTIDQLVPEPANARAYSAFHYEYNGITHQGIARGITGYRVGQPITLTVSGDAPDIYWVGNAKEELLSEIIQSAIGVLWLAVCAAFLIRSPLGNQ